MGTGSRFGAYCGKGVVLTTDPHLRPRLKEEYSYTSNLHGLLYK